MIRMATLWAAALLLVAVGTAACGGDDGTGELSLDDYLILTLQVEADQSRSAAAWHQKLADLWDDPDAYLEARTEGRPDADDSYSTWSDALAQVTPPPEAQAYHATLLDLLPELEKYADGLAATEDLEERSELGLKQAELSSDLAEARRAIQDLTVTVLETRSDDPLNAYLSAAAKARQELDSVAAEMAWQQMELLASGVPDETEAILALFDTYLAAWEDFGDRWQELAAPPEAEDLHQRQAELTADFIAMGRRALESLPDPAESTPVVEPGAFDEAVARSHTLNADWNEMLIEALSR